MKVLWAFDPFHHELSSSKAMFRLLAQFAGSPKDIDVGFVATRLPLFS
jgi:hypothetical protein